jgi:hypothetical protein
MPRSTISETPMTGAERQARYRAVHAAGAPVVRTRRPADRRSRIQRWNDTIAALTELQVEYGAWLDALPDNQARSPHSFIFGQIFERSVNGPVQTASV